MVDVGLGSEVSDAVVVVTSSCDVEVVEDADSSDCVHADPSHPATSRTATNEQRVEVEGMMLADPIVVQSTWVLPLYHRGYGGLNHSKGSRSDQSERYIERGFASMVPPVSGQRIDSALAGVATNALWIREKIGVGTPELRQQ